MMPMMIDVLIFAAGLLVYLGYGLPGFLYLAGATLASWIAGKLTPRHRWVMWISVGLNALMLVMIKLEPYTALGLLAPMGISYFALRIISYNVDVYREKIQPEQNLFRYALYVTYLPYMYLGPIERYDPQRFRRRTPSWECFWNGAVRILWGAFKKLVIAARIGVITSAIAADTEQYRGLFALSAMLLYSVQLYADFSGGIDMVLGISSIFGVPLSENFDVPYFAESFREFWRRWHMTLGGWLREYIYIPLGGNRKGKLRKLLNLVITFLVSGLWHGAHYLLWGALNGLFVACGEKFKTKWKALNRVLMFLAVSLLWSFFVWPDTVTALKMVASVFTQFNGAAFVAGIGKLGLTGGDWIVLAVAALILWYCDVFRKRLTAWYGSLPAAAKTALICSLGLLVLVFGMYGIGFDAQAFIYSSF